jgi:hypothetical protein
LKICSKCNTEKELALFFNRKDTKDGKQTWCKPCDKLRYDKYYKENKEHVAERNKKRYADSRDKYLEYATFWRKANKEYCANYSGYRRALKLKATPSWANKEEIASKYRLAAYFDFISGGFVKHHVDHIIPLKHNKVCGLHVENNLQILIAQDNLSKHNTFEVI